MPRKANSLNGIDTCTKSQVKASFFVQHCLAETLAEMQTKLAKLEFSSAAKLIYSPHEDADTPGWYD